MVIYDTPLISRVSSIWSAVPPTIIILNPPSALLLSPGFHELFWILVQFLDTTGGAAPIRKLKMWLVHRRLPVSSPFKTDRYANSTYTVKEAAYFVIGSSAIIAEYIKSRSPLMIGAVAAARSISYNVTRFSPTLSV